MGSASERGNSTTRSSSAFTRQKEQMAARRGVGGRGGASAHASGLGLRVFSPRSLHSQNISRASGSCSTLGGVASGGGAVTSIGQGAQAVGSGGQQEAEMVSPHNAERSGGTG